MVLVIGASGTVGREVVKLLSKQAMPARALLHRGTDHHLLHIDAIRGDLKSPETVEAVFQNVEEVVLITPSNPDQARLERNAIDLAKSAGCRQVIKLSMLRAKGKPASKMAQWHAAGEKALFDSGLNYTILRCHNFMQNLLKARQDIVNRGILQAPLGRGRIAMVDARDIAEAIVNIVSHKGQANQIYRLTGETAISYYEAAEILSEVVGRPVRYEDVPAAVMINRMVAAGVEVDRAEELVSLYQQFAAGKGAKVWPDLESLLGRKRTTFGQFVQDYRSQFFDLNGMDGSELI